MINGDGSLNSYVTFARMSGLVIQLSHDWMIICQGEATVLLSTYRFIPGTDNTTVVIAHSAMMMLMYNLYICHRVVTVTVVASLRCSDSPLLSRNARTPVGDPRTSFVNGVQGNHHDDERGKGLPWSDCANLQAAF